MAYDAQRDVEKAREEVAGFGKLSYAQIGTLGAEIQGILNQLSILGSSTKSDYSVLSEQLENLSNQLSNLSTTHTIKDAKLAEDIESLSRQLSSVGKSLQLQIKLLCDDIRDTEIQVSGLGGLIQRGLSESSMMIETIGAALNEDIILGTYDGYTEFDVIATELNAASSGSFTMLASIRLYSNDNIVHNWANFEPIITPAESVTDVDVSAPVVKWTDDLDSTPVFVAGVLNLTVVFDSDAGSTKTYVEGDEITITVDVSNIQLCTDVTNLVLTYTVV